MPKILIVDDEHSQREIMAEILISEGYEVYHADSVANAENAIKAFPPEVVLTDLKMPGKGGLELIKLLGKLEPSPEVVVITAFGSIETAVTAMRLGAFDYLTKPLDGEEFVAAVKRALEKFRLKQASGRLKEELNRDLQAGLIAESPGMKNVLDIVQRVADSDATVLIRGESGTGKERIARMIHYQSYRCHKLLLTVNCAAFPESLLESELFGYEKGAFTGALSRKEGLIETASDGSLFLDEIGDMSLNTQTRLLRVLQEKEIRRLGGSAVIKVNIRIIAATNRNLEDAIRQGRFRDDLFYRLNVVPIEIPPLRERKEDIPIMVQSFLGRSPIRKILAPEALEILREYEWPGNVRELEGLVQRVCLLSKGNRIGVDDLPREIKMSRRGKTEREWMGEFPKGGIQFNKLELHLLEHALFESNGNMVEAAKLLGMSYRTFRYRALKFGITPKIQN